MINGWLPELVEELRRLGAEVATAEVKAAAGGLPASARESLCAFANTPGGGYLVLGLADAPRFEAVGVADADKMQSDLAAMCRDTFTPALQPELAVSLVDGRPVVGAYVAELPRAQKPCYITAVGIVRGSYIRVGASDRRLTGEEVQQLLAERGQPSFDAEPVEPATADDLDGAAVDAYLRRLRTANPRLWATESDDAMLRMTKVTVRTAQGGDVPTLAGLLALARYPQQFFPQLNVTFVHYPTATGESTPLGVRFLDNVSINGPIPYLVPETLSAIQRNMTRRSLVTGAGRADLWEYPVEALREAVVNALVHRDLSPGSRGTQVQVEMYPDRLRIHNPGGLFGPLDIQRLAEEGRSSARNAVLMKILEDVTVPGENRTVCENRGSGIRAMIGSLRRAGMSPPHFRDRVTAFDVEMPNHALLDDETVAWLNRTAPGLRETQCLGLALMRRGEVLDNARYRTVTGLTDSRAATYELGDLVARELIDQTGSRGGARYTLASGLRDEPSADRRRPGVERRRQIAQRLASHGPLSRAELAEALSLSQKTVEHWLREMRREGLIETQGGRGIRDTRYRLTSTQMELFRPGSGRPREGQS